MLEKHFKNQYSACQSEEFHPSSDNGENNYNCFKNSRFFFYTHGRDFIASVPETYNCSATKVRKTCKMKGVSLHKQTY